MRAPSHPVAPAVRVAPVVAVIAACVVATSLMHAAPARALDRPGRAPVVHPEAAAEELLARATSLLDAGDASGALAIVSSSHQAFSALSPVQRFRRFRIEGLALLALGRAADAAAPLRDMRSALSQLSATSALDDDGELSLARAEAAAGNCREALRALRRAGAGAVFARANAVVLQARCQRELGADDAALRTLDAAALALADDESALGFEVRELRARLLVARGVRASASADVAMIARALDADRLASLAEEWQALAPELARILVDAGVARFPDDARFPALDARLARIDAPRAAAQAALRAALLDDHARADAVEMLRATGDVAGARRVPVQSVADVNTVKDVHSTESDGANELRQRLALAVDAGDWDRAVALQPRIARARLLDDDAVAYALSWAHHEVGNDVEAERLLDGIEDGSWFERATQLRGIIASSADAARRP